MTTDARANDDDMAVERARVRLKTLDELPRPDWRQAAEEEHALRLDAEVARDTARADLATMQALLAEWATKGDETTMPAGYHQWGMESDQACCQYCDWDARYESGVLTYPHTAACLVSRTRKELEEGNGNR